MTALEQYQKHVDALPSSQPAQPAANQPKAQVDEQPNTQSEKLAQGWEKWLPGPPLKWMRKINQQAQVRYRLYRMLQARSKVERIRATLTPPQLHQFQELDSSLLGNDSTSPNLPHDADGNPYLPTPVRYLKHIFIWPIWLMLIAAIFVSTLAIVISVGIIADITKRYASVGLDITATALVTITAFIAASTFVLAWKLIQEKLPERSAERYLTPGRIALFLCAILFSVGAFYLYRSVPRLVEQINQCSFTKLRDGAGHVVDGRVIRELQRALSLDPYSLKSHYLLAVAYEGQSNYDKAIEEYKNAQQLCINFTNSTKITLDRVNNNLARLYLIGPKKIPDQAEDLLRQTKCFKFRECPMPDHYAILKNLANAQMESEHIEAAKATLKEAHKALCLNPKQCQDLDDCWIFLHDNPCQAAATHCLMAMLLKKSVEKNKGTNPSDGQELANHNKVCQDGIRKGIPYVRQGWVDSTLDKLPVDLYTNTR